MKYLLLLSMLGIGGTNAGAQMCNTAAHRQFDFWIGEWEAFGLKGQKAGDSKITAILDSCVILEEWTSTTIQRGVRFAGKSFNSYNSSTRQWQQTWTDNSGSTIEYLRGEGTEGKIIYYADKVAAAGGKFFIRRLSFTKINTDNIRQLGERSDDGGATWRIEYDLAYKRKKP
jgi:hypothetical protein